MAMYRWLLLLLLATITCQTTATNGSYCDELVNGISVYGSILRANVGSLDERVINKTCLDAIDARYAFVYEGHIIEDINELDHLYGIATLQHCTFSKETIPPVPQIPKACGIIPYCDELVYGITTYGYICDSQRQKYRTKNCR